MAIVYMTSVNVSTYDSQIKNIAYEYDTGDKAVAGNGDTIIVPNNIDHLNVTLEITAGSGKVQSTNNKLADVISDTDVVWVDWLLGTITSTAEDSCTPPTALRMVNATGTTRMLVRGQ